MNYPQQIYEMALEMVFPIRCLGCKEFSSSKTRLYICKSCFKKIPIKNGFECIGCKNSSPLGKTCLNCNKTIQLDQLLIASDYNNPLVVKIIKSLKYRFIQELANPISSLIRIYAVRLQKNKNFNLLSEDAVIIPVPLHARRHNWRGFNQAEIIAKSFADSFQYEIRTDILFRTKKSKPQAEIEQKEERLKNTENSFAILNSSDIKNKTIILIDDICTTGATLNECAKILKENGAKKVIGFVVARG